MPRIAIDTRRRVGSIDPRIFGGFAEHLRRCVYGGLYEPGSPRADAHGFRRDVIDGTRRLGVTNVRWSAGEEAPAHGACVANC
jgi:alpha-N-arabinofuranosidase